MKRLIIVTGTAGAGKSTALRALEDLGYFGIDNLPALLLEPLAENRHPHLERIAAVMDARDPDFLEAYHEKTAWMLQQGIEVFCLFLHAHQDVLLRRFSQLRRPHPLFAGLPLPSAIAEEGRLLQPLRAAAATVIDTTDLSPHQLKAQLRTLFDNMATDRVPRLMLYSFGFKHGMPPEADMVLDVRFLPNPYFVAELKEMTGLQRQVADYVLESEPAKEFLARLLPLLRYLIPMYASEGKASFTIAIGCTGGRHRSVAMVEQLQQQLAAEGYSGKIWHRELETL
ncbi:MAG: RNase adapter RapZ [Deltaproteobacteria bacterium]